MLCQYDQHIIPWSILPHTHTQTQKRKKLSSPTTDLRKKKNVCSKMEGKSMWALGNGVEGIRRSLIFFFSFLFFSFIELRFLGNSVREVLIWFSNVQSKERRGTKKKERKKLSKANQKEKRKSMNSIVTLILIPKKTWKFEGVEKKKGQNLWCGGGV